MSDDNVVILNNGDDEDSTIFQTTQDREKILQSILDDEDVTLTDTTIKMHSSVKSTYWQQNFG